MSTSLDDMRGSELIDVGFIWFTVILKQKTLVCQFASPLDVDQHNKPEVSRKLTYLKKKNPLINKLILKKLMKFVVCV